MHALPHCISAPMHQCTDMLCACSWQKKRLKPKTSTQRTKKADMKAKTHKHRTKQGKGISYK